jgi:hypothetical protein
VYMFTVQFTVLVPSKVVKVAWYARVPVSATKFPLSAFCNSNNNQVSNLFSFLSIMNRL